ncbi:hypothetical protein VRC64_03600 [Pseudomonas poae]
MGYRRRLANARRQKINPALLYLTQALECKGALSSGAMGDEGDTHLL